MTLSMPTAEPSTPDADVRQVGQLEQALHRAVLAVRAVQQREHDVDAERRARIACDELSAPGIRRARTGSPSTGNAAGSASRPASSMRPRLVGEQPAPVGRDRRPARSRTCSGSSARATATAVTRETSCSADRPPNKQQHAPTSRHGRRSSGSHLTSNGADARDP